MNHYIRRYYSEGFTVDEITLMLNVRKAQVRRVITQLKKQEDAVRQHLRNRNDSKWK